MRSIDWNIFKKGLSNIRLSNMRDKQNESIIQEESRIFNATNRLCPKCKGELCCYADILDNGKIVSKYVCKKCGWTGNIF